MSMLGRSPERAKAPSVRMQRGKCHVGSRWGCTSARMFGGFLSWLLRVREWKPKGNPGSCKRSNTDCIMRPRDGDRKQKQQFLYWAGFMLPKVK